MAKVINPFIVTGKIEPEYFCDRIQESARLIKSVTNGNNMVIISPRRMGKTGLIQFCYEKPGSGRNIILFSSTFYIHRGCVNLPICWGVRFMKHYCSVAEK